MKKSYTHQGEELSLEAQARQETVSARLPSGEERTFLARWLDETALLIEDQNRQYRIPAFKEGNTWVFLWQGNSYRFEKQTTHKARSAVHSTESDGALRAPMPGLITKVLCQVGDGVEAGQRLVVMEAMKTEQTLRAPFAGRMKQINAQEGQIVEEGALLVELEPTN